MPNETIWGYGAATTGYPEPYAQYAPAVVEPPAGSDVIEEWELFYGLAQRMGLQLDGSPAWTLDDGATSRRPTSCSTS